MNATPNTRHRHALRWVLGVGLVFVVVVAMALQAARSRAGERWLDVVSHWDKEWIPAGGMEGWSVVVPSPLVPARAPGFYTDIELTGGNIFRAWRRRQWRSWAFNFVLRQERNFFGSSIEARLSGGGPAQVEMARAIFAAVDVELVVEP